jgi:hypothetical protein
MKPLTMNRNIPRSKLTQDHHPGTDLVARLQRGRDMHRLECRQLERGAQGRLQRGIYVLNRLHQRLHNGRKQR